MDAHDSADAAMASGGALRPLSELDWKVTESDPDVRGWTVQASDGSELGRVKELLVDTTARRVRYLDVARTDGAHVRVPVEQMTADHGRRVVVVQGIDGAAPRTAPADSAHVKVTDDEIRIPIVEEQLVVEKRPVVTEELVVKKSEVTREQKIEADLRRERVDVERTDRNDKPR